MDEVRELAASAAAAHQDFPVKRVETGKAILRRIMAEGGRRAPRGCRDQKGHFIKGPISPAKKNAKIVPQMDLENTKLEFGRKSN